MPYADPEKRKRYMREYQRLHPEKFRASPEENRKYYLSSGRRSHLQRTYGLTEIQVEEMKQLQGGKCAICQDAVDRLCVDHDHKTGEVRGLLCVKCNGTLGSLEKPGWLSSAQKYLSSFKPAVDFSEFEHMLLL